MDERTAVSVTQVVRDWMSTRDRIVQNRQTAELTGLFMANQGTHMAFLRELETAARSLAGSLQLTPQAWQALGMALHHDSPVEWEPIIGMLPAWNPLEYETFRELTYSWNSTLNSGKRSGS